MSGAPVEALQRVPLFADLNDDEPAGGAPVQGAALQQKAKRSSSRARAAAAFFVILSGEATVFVGGKERSDPEGGDYFGEIALIDAGTRMATITASSELLCYGSLLGLPPASSRTARSAGSSCSP